MTCYPDLDVAANHGAQFGRKHYPPEIDGLKQDWATDSVQGVVFCHPPFEHKRLGEWVSKSWHESQRGCLVIAMLPLWRKYPWLHDIVFARAEILYPKADVVCSGFGLMAGKKCGNSNWYNEYETIFAVFREGQNKGFCGGWL